MSYILDVALEHLATCDITYLGWTKGVTTETTCDCGGKFLINTKGADHIEISYSEHSSSCDVEELIAETKAVILFMNKQFLEILTMLFSKNLDNNSNPKVLSARSVAAKFLGQYSNHLIPGHCFDKLMVVDHECAKMLSILADEPLPSAPAFLIAC
jgi:hypothetical protein